jgi:hypothetical protein
MSLLTLEQLIEQRTPEQSAARLILCERQDNWATALVRTDRDVRDFLYETRSLQQMREALEISPRSFLGIELTETNFDTVLEMIICLPQSYPQAIAVILTNRYLRRYEWVLRQAGAIAFLVSDRNLRSLIEMARRHIDLTTSDSPNPVQNIWQRLPWKPRRTI